MNEKPIFDISEKLYRQLVEWHQKTTAEDTENTECDGDRDQETGTDSSAAKETPAPEADSQA